MKEFLVEYNSENYVQQVSIFRLQSEDANPANKEYDQFLMNDMINSIEIISDVMLPLLTGKLKYTDVGSKFIHKVIPDSRSFCRISIVKTDKNKIESKFEHLFIVRDVKLLSKETSTYELDLISHYWFNFNNLVNYTTMNNNEPLASKPFTTIIYEMMKKGNISTKKPDLQTTLNMQYSTTANYSLLKSVNDIIQNYDPSVGLLFLRYNLVNDQYEIVSTKKLFKDLDVTLDNQLIFPTRNTTGDNRRMIEDTKLGNDIGFHNMVNYTAPQTIKSFSYDKREWKDITWNRKNISSMFYTPLKDYLIKFKTVPNFVPSEVRKVTYENLDLNFINSDQLRQILISSETLQGSTNGILERMAGDLSVLLTDSLKDDTMAERVFGTWFIGRVFHKFGKQTYKNVIQMSRVDYFGQIGKDIESNNDNRGRNV